MFQHHIEGNEKQLEETNESNVLVLKGISKAFSGIKAVDNVDLDIRKGEVHALLGENGAGKSTLMKIIYGIYSRDDGDIFYQGQKVDIQSPLDAKKNGIVFVQQEISIVPELSVAENIFLGSSPVKSLNRVDWKKLRECSRKILDELKCNFSENEITANLTIAQQQMVEIARALAFNPNLIIFDEPTSSLTEQEKQVLFENIREQKAKGIGIIYISHRMDEIFEISDRITVLRDGKKTGTLLTSETNAKEITKLMIGRDIVEEFQKNCVQTGEEKLKLEGLTQKGFFEDISFTLRKGEVLGLYGLIGAGRSEVAEAIFGLRQPDSGKIYINQKEQRIPNSKKAVKLGIGFVPEDRKKHGFIGTMSCRKNLSLAKLFKMKKYGFIDNKNEASIFKNYQEKLAIKTSSPEKLIINLSGGNQQKIVIAKWMANNPQILILDEPTRGIDVGSKSQVHHLIRKMAEEGLAVLVISSEMPEIIRVCDRIITMYNGNITSELCNNQLTEHDLVCGAIGQIN